MANPEESPIALRLLGIYLNDHLAGATGGTALARRIAGALKTRPEGPLLADLAEQIAEDRRALIGIMNALEIPVHFTKSALGWLAERIGRLKLNGRLLRRSPLSTVLELELLSLGVAGKRASWRVLRGLCEQEPRLDAARLDLLLERADGQAALLESLRLRAASEAFLSAASRGLGPAPARILSSAEWIALVAGAIPAKEPGPSDTKEESMSKEDLAPEESEESTGTADEHYNLVSILYHSLQCASTCNTYIEDARERGDEELTQFFKEVQEEERNRAERAKELLVERLQTEVSESEEEEKAA